MTDLPPDEPPALFETATFGGGCFWCIEAAFQFLDGVESAVPGYMGGTVSNPTYEQVCTGTTGHAEVVRVRFNPKVTPYRELLDLFWKIHDPTTLNRQGADVGSQYRSAIFYYNEEQKKAAEKSIQALNEAGTYGDPVVTEVTPASEFHEAEEYHQNYYQRNPNAPYCQAVILPKLRESELKD